ncbi:magnesium chelatase [Candidatus Marinamargulisbacteria bacterium SCGC AG-439-L15]|nr:magnesium chelatase [Candidatus Marinamargulisbacteria bacterium SCGC AG-439-L15]
MLAKVNGVTLHGINAVPITVEVDASRGLPNETIVGLPDTVIRESKSRIKTAIKQSQFEYPLKNYTINLAPAEIKKEGPLLDLAIAVGVLQSTQQLPLDDKTIFIGELSLDGNITPVRGALAICHQFSQSHPKHHIFISYHNYGDVQLLKNPNIIPLKTLQQLPLFYQDPSSLPKPRQKKIHLSTATPLDFKDVKGQLLAKRGLEIAAAGKHNVLLVGPPGSGKSMLLKRLPYILPKLSVDKTIETGKIHNLLSSKLSEQTLLSQTPPFRAPHHSISYAGMVGGGTHPKPGEISLAHHGILFLDELPEFSKQVLEVLRQPLEDKEVLLSRAMMSVRYPANFMFVAAMNPCPCGYYNSHSHHCNCRPHHVTSYLKKISGPILDRIDLIIEVPKLKKEDYFESPTTEKNTFTNELMSKRIQVAQHLQRQRYHKECYNADISPKVLDQTCPLSEDSIQLLSKALDKHMITGRSLHKCIKVARTIADLEEVPHITYKHIAEALQLRKFKFKPE